MNCDTKNQLYLTGNIDTHGLWPKSAEFKKAHYQFKFDFGLDSLPESPGLITIRGPRQYGKSTWLELQLRHTLERFGKGSAFILNGDEIYGHEEFESKLLQLEIMFNSKAKVRRLFIDEITAIKDWQKVIKRLIDSGHLQKCLIVTTGSNASDLRSGSERLPGRKGKLPRHDYVFLPISYKEYLYQVQKRQVKPEKSQKNSDIFWKYLLSGGSPVALNELHSQDHLSDNFNHLIKDWFIGDITNSGRSKIFALSILRKIYEFGTSRVSYTKLAKEAGLANNSAALDYVERMSDLLILSASMQWDHQRKIFLARKPSKFNFINLTSAIAFHPLGIRSLDEINQLSEVNKACLYEWAVAQELYRRENLINQTTNHSYGTIENFGYWAPENHEIDFVTSDEEFYEVKSGQVSIQDFFWFTKVFPKKKLHLISESSFETDYIQSTTLEEFFLSPIEFKKKTP